MINKIEWTEVEWDAKRWTVRAAKMKSGWDHVVPLSRQPVLIFKQFDLQLAKA